jgi:hypothetical protein
VQRIAVALAVCAMLLSGCGGDGDTVQTTTTRAVPSTTVATTVSGATTPLEAATAWLDALAIGKYGDADRAVVGDQFVLLLALESYSLDLYDDLVTNGVSPAVSRNFWESFVGGVRGFTGADITEVEVIGAGPFDAYGRSFAVVDAQSPRGDLTIVVVEGGDGWWRVDLFATFGPTFAPLLNLWVDRLGNGAPPEIALAGQLPSLRVASDRAHLLQDPTAGTELDRLILTLSP